MCPTAAGVNYYKVSGLNNAILLTVLKVRSQTWAKIKVSACLCSIPEVLGENLFSSLFQLLEAALTPWLVSPFLHLQSQQRHCSWPVSGSSTLSLWGVGLTSWCQALSPSQAHGDHWGKLLWTNGFPRLNNNVGGPRPTETQLIVPAKVSPSPKRTRDDKIHLIF